MSDPTKPAADRDDDPDETDLVAYLDGELDPPAARAVESKLSADPDARAKADALKKTYDLLDFLPKPEPSPTFASRTLDRLPAAGKSGAPTRPVPAPAPTPPPAPVPSGPLAPPRRGGRWGWTVGFAVVVAGGLGVGYLGSAAARAYLFPPPRGADNLSFADLRVIRNLPLYAAVDDLDFAARLAEPDYFGDDPAVTADPLPGAVPADAAEKPWARALDPLVAAFRAMPADRQQEIRQLDAQLHDKDAAARDRLFRVMEAYAVWLDRLPDGDRKAVMSATTAARRLMVVRDLREDRWLAALPLAQRKQLEAARGDDRARLIAGWKDDEAKRRQLWQLARPHLDQIRDNVPPWPFDSEPMRNDVQEFVRAVFKPDDPRAGRLTADELADLRDAQEQAKSGAWSWYGIVVYQLDQRLSNRIGAKAPTLPEPAGREPVTDLTQLPTGFEKQLLKPAVGGGVRKNLRSLSGRWPEFALGVADEARRVSAVLSLPLGPARPGEFKPAVNDFLANSLAPRLSKSEADGLRDLEGRWPDYPKRLIELARKHDLSVPGVMLPGAPSKWDKTYLQPRAKKDGGA